MKPKKFLIFKKLFFCEITGFFPSFKSPTKKYQIDQMIEEVVFPDVSLCHDLIQKKENTNTFYIKNIKILFIPYHWKLQTN